MRLLPPFVVLGVLGGLFVATACTAANDAKSTRLCAPKNFVYCRCADLSEGTKQCSEGADSFSDCACEGEGGEAPPEGGLGETTLDPVETKVTTGAKIPSSCVGKLGLVAGAANGTEAYVATYSEAGRFTVSVSKGPGLRSPVSIAATGRAIVATYLSRYTLLAWTKFENGSWSAPVSIGSAYSATKPSVVPTKVDPAELSLFYFGTDGKFHTGKYTSGWDDAVAPAEASMNDSTSIPGRSAPSGAITGTTLAFAFSGSDGSANFATSADGIAWSAVQHVGVRAAPFAPTLIGTKAAQRDLLAVYSGADMALRSIAHDKIAGTLEPPLVVDSAAYAQDPVQLANMPDGRVMMLYRGTNSRPYFAVYDPVTNRWTTPAEVLPGHNPEIAWTPSVTTGRCGSDITAGYAELDGRVRIVRYTNGTWEGPFEVSGIEKVTYVGVAELP